MVQQSPLPVYAVSGGMKIVFCNEALCRWTGCDDEFLTELVCVYQSASDQPPARQIATGLCPPPDSFQGDPSEAWVSVPVSGDRLEYRQATFVPTRSVEPEEDKAGVIVFVHGNPQASPQLRRNAEELADARHLHAAVRQMQYESACAINIDRLVGRSPVSQKIRRQVDIAGKTEVNVLVIGPRGSGRRSIAPLIHYAQGPERVGPLIPIHGPVCDAETLQTTLQDLSRNRTSYPDEPPGRISLQNVDQLSEAAQAELLNFQRRVDFRLLLLATALPGCKQRILPELWQLLSTVVIELPPLGQRREDIPYLAQALVEQFNAAGHAQLSGIDDETLAALVRYSWPGELDELTEAIDFGCSRATPPVLRWTDLPEHLRIAMRVDGNPSGTPRVEIDLDQFLAEIEDELIRRAVAQAAGNKSEAARLLGISRARLLRRLHPENGSTAAADGERDKGAAP